MLKTSHQIFGDLELLASEGSNDSSSQSDKSNESSYYQLGKEQKEEKKKPVTNQNSGIRTCLGYRTDNVK